MRQGPQDFRLEDCPMKVLPTRLPMHREQKLRYYIPNEMYESAEEQEKYGDLYQHGDEAYEVLRDRVKVEITLLGHAVSLVNYARTYAKTNKLLEDVPARLANGKETYIADKKAKQHHLRSLLRQAARLTHDRYYVSVFLAERALALVDEPTRDLFGEALAILKEDYSRARQKHDDVEDELKRYKKYSTKEENNASLSMLSFQPPSSVGRGLQPQEIRNLVEQYVYAQYPFVKINVRHENRSVTIDLRWHWFGINYQLTETVDEDAFRDGSEVRKLLLRMVDGVGDRVS